MFVFFLTFFLLQIEIDIAYSQSTFAMDKEVEKSVLLIISKTESGGGTGSGFIVTKEGHLVTNHHVIYDSGSKQIASDLEGRLSMEAEEDDASAIFQLDVLWFDEDYDLAILKIKNPPPNLHPAILTSVISDKGDRVYTLGFPGITREIIGSDDDDYGRDPDLTQGYVHKLIEKSQMMAGLLITHDAEVYPGNSGGPLFDRCHRVVGINTAIFGEGDLPVSKKISVSIKKIIKELKNLNLEKSINLKGDSCQDEESYSPLGIIAIIISVLCLWLFVNISRDMQLVKNMNSNFVKRVSQKASNAISKAYRKKFDKSTMCFLSGFDASGFKFKIDMDKSALRSKDGFVVGRDPSLVDFSLDSSIISKRQVRFRERKGKIFMTDLNSANRTKVNGRKIESYKEIKLSSRDEIVIGTMQIDFNQQAS